MRVDSCVHSQKLRTSAAGKVVGRASLGGKQEIGLLPLFGCTSLELLGHGRAKIGGVVLGVATAEIAVAAIGLAMLRIDGMIAVAAIGSVLLRIDGMNVGVGVGKHVVVAVKPRDGGLGPGALWEDHAVEGPAVGLVEGLLLDVGARVTRPVVMSLPLLPSSVPTPSLLRRLLCLAFQTCQAHESGLVLAEKFALQPPNPRSLRRNGPQVL